MFVSSEIGRVVTIAVKIDAVTRTLISFGKAQYQGTTMTGHPASLPTLVAVLLLALLLGTACTTPAPTLDTSPLAEVTYDGLYPIRGGTAQAAWARRDADISRYSKIMLQGVGISYRPGGETDKLYHLRSADEHFEISEQQKERFRNVLREEFRKELERSQRFRLVDEPGPDVLLIRGGVLDVVSYVPPEPSGRSQVFLSRVAEATLVLEILDSVSETIMVRVVDRRAAENKARGFRESNRVANTAEVRRMVGFWARTLRERLDSYGIPGE